MQNPFDIALPDPEEASKNDTSSWRWATVIQVTPLRIMLDGDSEALDAQPSNIAGTMWEGARVYVQIIGGTKPIVIGAGSSGGPTKLAEEFMSTDSSSHTLHIPSRYHSEFSRYSFTIIARALSSDTATRPVSIRPNGYSGDYRYTATAFEAGITTVTGATGVGSVPRSFYVGSSLGVAYFTVAIRDSHVFGTGRGYSQRGSAVRRTFLTGQMSDKDPAEPITHFVINTNSTESPFASNSHVTLWGYR